jgi:alcohol dehydrogenase, propanol-preferring
VVHKPSFRKIQATARARLITLAQKSDRAIDRLQFPIGAKNKKNEEELNMASKMHAAVVEQFGKPLELREWDVPSPAAGQILLKTEACGVCHTDLHAAHGDWPVKPTLPFIPGHEAIGLVTAVGSGVTIVKEGDRVGVPWLYSACGHCEYCLTGWETVCAQAQFGGYTANGGFAEYVIADPNYVAHVPNGLTATEAAPLICAGITTYKGIKQTEARPGEWVAISGAGGLGHLAIQYAKAMGLLVCAIDIDDGKLAHATRLGADFVINAKTGDPAAAVKKATGGGAHGVLITAPSLIAFKQGVGMTRKRGTCVLVGLPPGEFPVPLFDVVANCITIRGSFVGTRQDMAEALAFAVGGKVKADIELQPLSSINQIFDRLERGDVPSRVVLDFAPAKAKNQRSEQDQHLATTGAGSARVQ